MTIVAARPASTVVLLRPSTQRFDVCLVRRHDQVAFMGGAHVFPGGRVDESDCLSAPNPICDGLETAIHQMPMLSRAQAIGHYVAAIRELFEEAGIFLARRGSQFVSFDDPIEAARFAEYRNQLVKRTTTMEEVVRREHLQLVFDGMVWFAHWLTPEIEIKRYDTRFFIAVAPPTQGFTESDGEITEAIWLDPATAITRCRREEIALPPPTWTTLRMLESFSSIKSVYQWVAGRRVVLVQPKFKKGVDTAVLTLPGDESYPPIPGFETPKETKFVLAAGRWRPIS